MQTMKETASNVTASAKAGMEKTKALVQEKTEKMSAHDPVEKEMAAEKKEERMARADVNKLEARQHNAAAKHAREAGMPAQYTTGPNYMTSGAHPHVTAPTGTHAQSVTGQAGYPTGTHAQSVTGQAGYPTGTHQMPAVPEAGGHAIGGPGTNVGGYGPGYVAPSGPGTGGTY